MSLVIDIWPQYKDLWDEYRGEFMGKETALGERLAHVIVSHTVYQYYRYNDIFIVQNKFRGKFLALMKAKSIEFSQIKSVYDNILKEIKIRDKDLYKTITKTNLDIDVKTEHSKVNKKTVSDPQTTEYSTIPHTAGEDMIGNTFGRSQLVDQKKTDKKKLTVEETTGRRVADGDKVRYEPTYDKEVGDRDTETTIEGDRSWLGRVINITPHLKFEMTEIIDAFAFLFVGMYSPPGRFIMTRLARKKWVPYTQEEIEEEAEEIGKPVKKKKDDDIADISEQEYYKLKEEGKPVEKSYYLEYITRYRKRKEKEKAPVGSLTGLAIDKQKGLADGLIKGWTDDPTIPKLTKYDAIMEGVMGYEQFKNELRAYIVNLAEYLEQGITELPDDMKSIFVLLGKPGTGKSFICDMLSQATGWYLINIDLGGRKDTEILEGTTPAVKGAFPGRLAEGFATAKQRILIVLLDEFEKIAGEGLAMMMGNVLDIKKSKDWQDQFLGAKVDISGAIFLATANYADQVPDFVQDRAKFVNIPLYTYEQRKGYVKTMLTKKLSKDELTKEYATQITDDFCKYIITETWGLRQTNINMAEMFKKLRYYKINKKKYNQGTPITDIRNYTKLEITKNNFIFHYEGGSRLDLVRTRAGDVMVDANDPKKVIGYTWLMDHEEAKWPNLYDTSATEYFKGHVIKDGTETPNATPPIDYIKVVYTK